MIFFWLGAWALMLFGLRETQISFSRLTKNASSNAFFKILEEASPRHSLKHGWELYRQGAERDGLLMLSFSFLGAWLVFILASLFLSFQGVLFLAIGAVGFLNFVRFPRRKDFFGVFWGAGIFLVGAEFLLRQSSVLQSLLGESDLAFALVDGRGVAVFVLAWVGFAGGLLIRAQFWSLTLGLALLASSSISFNGAMALFAGESVGVLALWAWNARSTPGFSKLKWWSVAGFVGAIAGFFIAWYFKEIFGWGSSFGMSGATERFNAFLLCAALMCLIQGFFQMVAGHFVSKRSP